MRISDNMRFQYVTRNMSRTREAQLTAIQQASTGRRVNAPSDDPVAAAEHVRNQMRLDESQSYRRNVSLVRGDMGLAESTLAEAGSVMQRVRELAMQGANDSVTAQERAVMSEEVEHLRLTLVDLGNATGARGTLFGGTQVDQVAFDSDGTFRGNTGTQMVAIGPGSTTAANISGADAFTAAGGRDLFDDLAAFRDALATDDTSGIRGALTYLDDDHKQLVNARARAGLSLERLDTTDLTLEQVELGLKTSDAKAVGMPESEAYTNLTTMGQALERAIAVAQQVLSVGNNSRF